MERRKFTREFKLEAVRLIKERGVSYVQASQDLGVWGRRLKGSNVSMARGPFRAAIDLTIERLIGRVNLLSDSFPA